MYSSQSENEFAEIPVGGYQQRLTVIGSAQDRIVVDTWIKLRHVAHKVAVSSQAVNDWPIHALISQEFHPPCPAVG